MEKINKKKLVLTLVSSFSTLIAGALIIKQKSEKIEEDFIKEYYRCSCTNISDLEETIKCEYIFKKNIDKLKDIKKKDCDSF